MGLMVPLCDVGVPLIDILGWQNSLSPKAVETVERSYATRVAASINKLIVNEPGSATDVLFQFATLNGLAVRRILMAPETSRRAIASAHGEAAALLPYLKHTIAAEVLRHSVGQMTADTEPILTWSATGDIILRRTSLGRVEIVHCASKLGALSAALDWNGWEDRASIGAGFSNLSELFADDSSIPTEYFLAQEKVKIAANVIAKTCPLAADFINSALSVVHLRQSVQSPESYFSYSKRDTIGRCVLVNAHLPTADVATIINALIHEAVHNFLYRIEQTHPLVHLHVLEQMRSYRSPWSGNMIRASTYVHACYIYHSLAQYWNLVACRDLMGDDICQLQTSFFYRGFAGNVDILGELADDKHIKSDPLDDIVAVTRRYAAEYDEKCKGAVV